MEAVKRFFSSPRFAVAGASNDSNKFGYKSMHYGDYMECPFLTFGSPRLVSPALAARDTA